MGILDLIKRDVRTITTNTEDFAGPVTFIHPEGLEIEVNVLHTLHHLGYDLQTAQEVNTLKAHVCVSEGELNEKLYYVRNAKNEITFKDHKIRAREASGQEWLYIVNQWFPNGTTGTVSLILGMHKQ